jgi:hypothetical protein
LSGAAQTNGTTAVTRTLNVSGSGKVTLAPDVAYVYIGVHSQNENVSAALTENNSKAQDISNTIKELGIDAKDIQTSSFNIFPQQQYSPEGTVTGVIYSVDNTVSDCALSVSASSTRCAQANSINGINFNVLNRGDHPGAATIQTPHQAWSSPPPPASAWRRADPERLHQHRPVPLYEAKGAAVPSVPAPAGQMVISGMNASTRSNNIPFIRHQRPAQQVF